MSEPIYLYDKHGELHVMHSPKTAHEMVVAGLLFVEPPAQPVDTRRQRELDALLPPIKRIDIPPQGIPGPNDTQDVPVVPTGKARRKSKGDGGVL